MVDCCRRFEGGGDKFLLSVFGRLFKLGGAVMLEIMLLKKNWAWRRWYSVGATSVDKTRS